MTPFPRSHIPVCGYINKIRCSVGELNLPGVGGLDARILLLFAIFEANLVVVIRVPCVNGSELRVTNTIELLKKPPFALTAGRNFS